MADATPLPSLDDAWEGTMIAYTEQDFHPSPYPYRRTVPGWRCLSCGHEVATYGFPPSRCPSCNAGWDRRGVFEAGEHR